MAEGAAASLLADLLTRCTFPPPGSELACAVSGGPDSLALLLLAREAGCAVCAYHVDHGLRPGSASEADRVARVAALVGAGFESRTAPVSPGANLEARARAARYAVLPPGVATGHTMDDQAETVLLRMLRGAGADGLAAMAPGTRHPLLELRRAETHALCAAAGLEPLCDPSNADPAFARNRVRHELLALCADIAGRDPVPLLARQAALLGEEAALLTALARTALPDPADTRSLVAAEPVLARRALRGWLQAEGAAPYPPSRAEVERVLAVARGEAVGTELARGVRVRRRAGRLRVEQAGVEPAGEEPGSR